ncbi:MAG: NAD(P)/FAD-dependent oxidoreductase [Candidatus Aminicenantes bacterium]|jgi:hypothetical protein|nr:NAD(P)/FAD-dependent oxidoreductase [Candidatus Aminicenantes bacterium]
MPEKGNSSDGHVHGGDMIAKDLYSLIVIGGGPAGLFCALRAAGNGQKILLLEKNTSVGRKLLLTGSGQCNITHDGDIRSFLSHYGDNGRFIKPSLLNFQNRDLVSFFSERELPVVTESGKVFPVSRKAINILDILVKECSAGKVEIRCGDPVLDVSTREGGFLIRTGRETFRVDHVVIATGGITYPVTGSTGDGLSFAKSLGHRVTEVGPALTAVAIQDYPFSTLSGISFTDVIISLIQAGRKVRQHTGDLLFTHSGLSGPGILDFSRYIRPGDTLRISFLPGVDHPQAKEILIARINAAGNRQVKKILAAFDLPDRFVRKLLDLAGIKQDQTGAQLSREARSALLDLLTGCPFIVSRLGGIHEAMVTRGGVSLDEINPKTMESRLVPGLFFVGEVLDIDGDTGGYNLQAAFSTGALAAKRIAEPLC